MKQNVYRMIILVMLPMGLGGGVRAEAPQEQGKDLEALIEQLRSGSSAEARYEAAHALGKMGDRRAVEPLIEAVVRGPITVGRPAVNVLDRMNPDWRTTAGGRSACDALLRRLKDADPERRRQAVFAIRMFRTRQAAEPLIALIDDENEDVRLAAIKAVPGVVDERAVAPLISQLVKSRWTLWPRILLALKEIGPQWYKRDEAKALVPVFLARLKEGGYAGREIEVLGELHDERAVDPIIGTFENTSRSRRQTVVALGKLGSRRAVAPLVRTLAVTIRRPIRITDGGDERRLSSGRRAQLHEYELAERNKIVGVLNQLDPDWRKTDVAVEAAKMLVEQLTAKEADVRERAACVLGELGHTQASALLIERLKDEDLRVRENACRSLARLRHVDALPALTLRLRDTAEDGSMRVLVAQTLGVLADPRAAALLMATLRDDDTSLRRTAAEALGRLKEKRALNMLLEATKDRGHAVRQAAGLAIGSIGDTSVVPVLIRQLESPDRSQCHGAGVALGALKDPRGVKALIRRLEQDRETGIPQWGPAALGQSRSPLAVAFLCSLLDDDRLQINRIAARALGQIGDARAVAPLLALLRKYPRDGSEALGEIGDPRAVEPLLYLLLDEREGVRWSAAKALRKITGHDFGTNGDAWMRWWKTQTQKP